MIKFFRKIRLKLLAENKLSKYLIYAVGEIILVVIGILIALQINNWNENEKLLKLEKEILEEVKIGLESDFLNIKKVIEDHQTFMNSQEKIIDWIENEKQYNDSLIPFFKHTTWITWFAPEDAQYESLKQFGVRNISNRVLGDQITKLYDVIYEELQLWQDEIRDKTIKYQELQGELGIEFTKYTPEISFEIQPSQPETLQLNKNYLFYLRLVNESMKQYTMIKLENAKLEIAKTISLIENELD
ncbi:DUF6090 family protein [Aegicerativicinus sediminis]